MEIMLIKVALLNKHSNKKIFFRKILLIFGVQFLSALTKIVLCSLLVTQDMLQMKNHHDWNDVQHVVHNKFIGEKIPPCPTTTANTTRICISPVFVANCEHSKYEITITKT